VGRWEAEAPRSIPTPPSASNNLSAAEATSRPLVANAPKPTASRSRSGPRQSKPITANAADDSTSRLREPAYRKYARKKTVTPAVQVRGEEQGRGTFVVCAAKALNHRSANTGLHPAMVPNASFHALRSMSPRWDNSATNRLT